MICLEEFDPGVKESAAWALGYIARHNAGTQIHRIVFGHVDLVSRQRRDGMFALNIMKKTRYDEVTAYCWTGSTDEFCGNILIYSQLRILSRNSSVDPVQQ